MTVTVRPSSAADAPAMLEVARALPEWFNACGLERMVGDFPLHEGLVAVEEGRVIGFLTWLPVDERVVTITWFGVRPERRGHGVGRRLLASAERNLADRGYVVVQVETLAETADYPPYEDTRRFYLATGFERREFVGARWGEGQDALVMQKPLRPDGQWYRGSVPPENDGASVAAFLRGRLGVSRRMLRRLRARGEVLVNGRPVTTRARLQAGDELVLVLSDLPSPNITPEDAPLAIIHEDEAIIAVDKPAGMLVHPVRGQEGGTLAQVIADHLSRQGLSPKPRPVHRLDRDTSGVIVFAKSAHAQHRLSLQFRRSEVHKEYVAVVDGWVADDEGNLSGWLVRVPRRMVAVDEEPPDGKGLWAETRFRVLERPPGGAATVLLLEPGTGRTHQLRAQLAAAGHPIIGDLLYGGAGDGEAPIGRQALHASAIEFKHPLTDQPMRLGAPIPPDMVRLVENLRAGTDV